MSPQSKRRRLSLLTLPVVVVIGFLVVAKLAAWQRSDLIADLADCISHGETRDAMEAVHKLAAIPNPPISVLVTAAASDEQETAGAAQVAIDRLLRRWLRDVEAKKRHGTIAGELSQLAKSLANTQTDFSESDHAWLDATVRKILRIANKFPPDKTPLVAVQCDAILTAIGAGRFPARPDESPGNDDFDVAIAVVPDEKAVSAPGFAASTDAGPGTNQSMNENERPGETTLTPFHPPRTTEPLLHSDDDKAADSSDDAPANELRSRSSGSAEEAASDRISSRPRLPQSLPGAPPIFRILPAMPINVPADDGKATSRMTPDSRTAAEGRVDASNDPLASTGSRELLKKWTALENGDAKSVERELAKRGFGKLSKPLVLQFFSDNPPVRMRLVNNVLAQPGGGSEAWLLLLAEDSDPDVRLFAVTFMATSNNAALVEKAWQLVIRDRDPRIADLAGRLRERREGPLRR